MNAIEKLLKDKNEFGDGNCILFSVQYRILFIGVMITIQKM